MRSRWSPLLLVLLVVACVAPTRAVPPPEASSAAAPVASRAFLWEVTRPGAPDKPLFLTGSVHLGKPGQFVFPLSMELAFSRSQALVVELDPDKASSQRLQGLVMHLGLLTPPDTLDAHLSPETRALLPVALQHVGLPLAAIERMRPWMVSLTLDVMDLQKAGYTQEGGIDQMLLERARGHMTIVELETPEEQIHVLAGFPDALQDLMLREQLQSASSSEEGLERISQAWQRGDAEALAALLFDNKDDPTYAPYYEALFFQRNRRMADKLTALLDSPRTHFVVVGAGHLVGQEGLIELLTRRGLQVRQLPREP